MNDFKIDDEHEHITFMFDSSNKAQDFARLYPEMKFTVISGKEENRLRGKCDSFEDLLKTNALNCVNAVKGLIPARSLREMMEQELLGGQKPSLSGVMLCKTCIDRAIASCEEVLQVLKDIKEDAK